MKRLFGIFIFISTLVACEGMKPDKDKSSLPNSSGKYGEVLIVVDTVYESAKTGEALDQIFNKALIGMPQQESQFRASTVPPKAFKSILRRSRNILKLSIGKNKKTAIKIERDVWAKNQLLIQITAGSDEDASRILNKNLTTIRSYFNEEEITRLQKQNRIKPQKKLMTKMMKNHQLSILVPPGYVEMAKDSTGFWLKKEKTIGQHQVLQGISVYYYPYESKMAFDNQQVVVARDVFTKEHIQGYRDSSYMEVYKDYRPDELEINLNGNYAVEYRGLWRMENDFMGGPFLHYTLIDEVRNRVINLDGFVFAPKFNKREYLRELEAIMKTIQVSKED